MKFNDHWALEGKHAFLSASQHAWTNYDDEKLDARFVTAMAAKRGTELHQLAHDLIRLGVKLPRNGKTLNLYVNDMIGFRMKTEVLLYVSENCFGTADGIRFEEKKNFLRIADLKTGVSPASVRQLEVYAAMFCLEYKYRPHELEIELRIYKSDEVEVFEADPDVILHLMDKIKSFDSRIAYLKEEADA